MSIRRSYREFVTSWVVAAVSFLSFVSLLASPVTSFQTSSSVSLSSHLHRREGATSSTRLFNESPPKEGGASVRFTGAGGDAGSTQTMNPLDTFLSYMSSDIASIALGAVGLLVIVVHRLSLLDESVDALALQTRTDLLAVFACGSVLLNGITKLDVTAALSESVVLEGTTLSNPELLISSGNKDDTISWVLQSLLVATPAKSVVLLQQENSSWSVAARAGVVSASTYVPDVTPILDRVSSPRNTKETYLPTLQALPGKKEFPYLPTNAQLALMIPISSSQVLVVAGNAAKSFTPRDVAWCRIVADRIDQ